MSTPLPEHQETSSSNGGTITSAASGTGSPGKGARNGLVQSLLTGDREGIGGATCNDRDGLCLGSRGAMNANTSGVFTSLVKLASQLDPGGEPPLITIETDKAALLVKEYDGHAVALRVPVTGNAGTSGTSAAATNERSQSSS